MRDNLGERKIWRLNIKVALDNLEIWRYLAKEFVGFFIGQIPQAKYLPNLAWGQQLLEL